MRSVNQASAGDHESLNMDVADVSAMEGSATFLAGNTGTQLDFSFGSDLSSVSMNNVVTSTPKPDQAHLSPTSSRHVSIVGEGRCDVERRHQVAGATSSTNSYGIKLVGDNVDKNVRTRYMRCDRQTKSLHYFHTYATLDRFNSAIHSEELPNIPQQPKWEDLLPSSSDITALEDNFSILLGRVLCQHMPFFEKYFVGAIPSHIDHPLAKEMSQKSEVVN